jgi:peroxiredoxin Q/BCP
LHVQVIAPTIAPAARASATAADPREMPAKAVPDFSLPATGGGTFDLAGARAKLVVLYFYPKDNTPGCTTEGEQFAALHKEFRKAGAEIYGVSRDSLRSHENFKAKMGFPFELLSDEDEKVCQQFGVIKMKNMYGKQVRGIERSTFVLDGSRAIRREWRGVKVPGHAKEVLDFVKTL